MSVLDDVCFTVHSSEGSGRTLMEVLNTTLMKCFSLMIGVLHGGWEL